MGHTLTGEALHLCGFLQALTAGRNGSSIRDSAMTYETSCRRSGYRTGKQRAAGLPPPLGFNRVSRAAYWHLGAPSLFAGSKAVDPMENQQGFWVFTVWQFAGQPSPRCVTPAV